MLPTKGILKGHKGTCPSSYQELLRGLRVVLFQIRVPWGGERGAPASLTGHCENRGQQGAKPGPGSEMAKPCRQSLSEARKPGVRFTPHLHGENGTQACVGEIHKQKAKGNIHQKLERFAHRAGGLAGGGGWSQSKDKGFPRERGKEEGRGQEEGTMKRKKKGPGEKGEMGGRGEQGGGKRQWGKGLEKRGRGRTGRGGKDRRRGGTKQRQTAECHEMVARLRPINPQER